MSILGDIFSGIVSAGRAVAGVLGGNSLGSTLLKTVLSGYALNRSAAAIRKQNSTANQPDRASLATTTVDPGVRLQVPPAQNQRVPVVYGTAQLGGIITEAVPSNSNRTMTYCLTICERTGIKLSDSAQSAFAFIDIFYNDQRISFETAGALRGIQAANSVDRTGTVDFSIAGLVRVFCFNGNSDTPVAPQGLTLGTVQAAYNIVPGWTNSHDMNGLIFAIVQVDYSADKGVTGLPTMRFTVRNNMTLPGDCLLDYMSNTRYGAGIPQAEIFTA